MIISSIFIETLTALKSFFILDPFGSLSVLFGFLSILSVHFGSLSISLVPFGSIWIHLVAWSPGRSLVEEFQT